jgi:sporulation protein YlmC with PRC-barrel domain
MVMTWDVSEILGYCVHARDGSLGTVQDMYFDDVDWQVRYLAVSGGSKSGSGRFLLAPEVISSTDREFGLISVFLRTAAVHDSPMVAADRDLPRQEERRLREYYGWPNYWAAPASAEQLAQTQAAGSPSLYSFEDVLGYRVLASGEDLGSLIDLVVDDHTWKIHALEVDARSWRPAGRVWFRPDCIQQVLVAKRQIALTTRWDADMTSPQPDLQVLLAPDGASALPSDTRCATQLHEWASAAPREGRLKG